MKPHLNIFVHGYEYECYQYRNSILYTDLVRRIALLYVYNLIKLNSSFFLTHSDIRYEKAIKTFLANFKIFFKLIYLHAKLSSSRLSFNLLLQTYSESRIFSEKYHTGFTTLSRGGGGANFVSLHV